MEFKHGVNVFTVEDDKVGSIEQVVVDPRTKEITHVIVRQGVLFTEDKVLPIEMIAAATEERVTLKAEVEDWETIPKFEETHYVRAVAAVGSPVASPGLQVSAAWPLYYLPANEPGKELLPHWNETPNPGYASQTSRNVPEDAVVLEKNATVISADDEHVGDVAEVFSNQETDRITHLVISRGLLFKEERLIPVSWIDKVEEEKIYLAVESSVLDRLHPYDGSSHRAEAGSR
jgi:uncharacterized protein YrrD